MRCGENVGKIVYKNGLQVSVGHLRVPGAGIEPARIAPLVFETSASEGNRKRPGSLQARLHQASDQVCRPGLRPVQGRRRPSYSFLQQLPSSVLLPYHRRYRHHLSARRHWHVHARRQRCYERRADHPHRYREGPAFRYPRGRPYRRFRCCHRDLRVIDNLCWIWPPDFGPGVFLYRWKSTARFERCLLIPVRVVGKTKNIINGYIVEGRQANQDVCRNVPLT